MEHTHDGQDRSGLARHRLLDRLRRELATLVRALDVTQREQIAQVVGDAQTHFGRIDVLVDNAGYGYLAAIEEGEDAAVRARFETDVFGLIDLTKSVLPILLSAAMKKPGTRPGFDR